MNEIAELTEGHEGEDWISVSDLMAGLLVIFIFIGIISIIEAENARKYQIPEQKGEGSSPLVEIKRILTESKEIETKLYNAIDKEFKDDSKKWNAKLVPEDLTLRFNVNEAFFDRGKSELKPGFEAILKDFFPRYLKILNSEEFKDHISEIRIEGHTSSEWGEDTPRDEAYFENMRLSQDRAREVLKFILSITQIENYEKGWAKKLLTVNGLSSSQIIKNVDDNEDKARSRRVEFKIRTGWREEIDKVIRQEP